jgi:hypothetical protein
MAVQRTRFRDGVDGHVACGLWHLHDGVRALEREGCGSRGITIDLRAVQPHTPGWGWGVAR